MDAASPTLSPAAHLRLALLRAELSLLLRATRSIAPLDELMARFPGLSACLDRAAAVGLEGCTLELAITRLDERLWTTAATDFPLVRLRDALSLDTQGIDIFLLCAACEDDPTIAGLVEGLRGQGGRPSAATFAAEDGCVPEALATLLEAGFLRAEADGRWRTLAVPPAVWDAAQGRIDGFAPLHALPEWPDLILPTQVQAQAQAALARHAPQSLCWVLPGRAGSGRQALAGALARACGLGLLHVPQGGQDPMQLAACATLLGAMPLLDLAPAPGERAELPALPWLPAPLAVRLPPQGGVALPGRAACWLELAMPERTERARHWQLALGRPAPDEALFDLRLPRGRIHRLAWQVGADAAAVAAEVDVQCRHQLEGLAQRVPPLASGENLALGDTLQHEFDLLLARCRHREALPGLLPAAFAQGSGTGVRALFKGPSGTGKTLAARQLATALLRPLYRVDLAATVSKYIGETERNLDRVFGAAEELDIVLLLDEGDALLAGRTGVSNANDRYANLETNFLLQRLERYDGILVVTTNAPERIDAAFARRMDATLEFAPPDAQTRHRLWCAHLPATHRVTDAVLDEVALRCALTGGQIRNAALHASLLALDQGAPPGSTDLGRALRREYARAGQACPSLLQVPMA